MYRIVPDLDTTFSRRLEESRLAYLQYGIWNVAPDFCAVGVLIKWNILSEIILA